jgi:soluble lytic murein transglycosylase-like protein
VAYLRLLVSCALISISAATAWTAGPSAPVLGTVVPSTTGIRELVDRVSREHGLDPKLVDAVVRIESAYNPRAVSHKGAMGLMQLMPATARRLGVDDPFDPEQNVRGGVRELARLVDGYRGNLQLALAAYNAGEGAVSRFRGVPPYNETRNYVSQILTIYTGRPYRMSASYRAPMVRMMTDPATGETVITNQPGGSSSRGLNLSRSNAGSGPLKGGFGSSSR